MASLYDALIDGTFNTLAMSQMERDLANSPVTRYAVDANGQRIDPIRLGASPGPRSAFPSPVMAYGAQPPQNAAVGAANSMAGNPMPPMPRPRPEAAPSRMDMAASNGMPLPGMVPGATPIPRAQEPGYQMGDGLISLLTGGKMQGLGGLLSGLMPKGGLSELLGGGQPATPADPTSYNAAGKAGMSDWRSSPSGTLYSPTLRDQHTSQTSISGSRSGGRAGQMEWLQQNRPDRYDALMARRGG